jgi:tRNA-2-methylthio-N6-dimethylallyladenosine synthase
MRYHLFTFGCQMNYSDSERIVGVLENLKFQKARAPESADLIIFNTCSVRQTAEDRVYGQADNILSLKNQNPRLRVGVTGCMVRVTSRREEPKQDELLKKLPWLDFVFRVEDTGRLPELLTQFFKLPARKINLQENQTTGANFLKTGKKEAGSLLSVPNYFSLAPKPKRKFSVFVPIMTGCDNFCTYCIVPYARGREVSRPEQEIVSECEQHLKNGALEIVLLGQNVNSYGKHLTPHLGGGSSQSIGFVKLLKKIHGLSGLQRLRFFTSHPKDLSADLIQAFADLPKLMPHLHLPLQSGDDATLRRMNRNYTARHYLQLLKKLRAVRPEIAISTDMIVGFPGETEEQFQNSLHTFEAANFSMAYPAKFSPRLGTAAAKLPDDVTPAEKTRRWHLLNETLKKSALKHHEAIFGKVVEVLVENCSQGVCTGRTPQFLLIRFKGSAKLVGKIVPVKITESRTWEARGAIKG